MAFGVVVLGVLVIASVLVLVRGGLSGNPEALRVQAGEPTASSVIAGELEDADVRKLRARRGLALLLEAGAELRRVGRPTADAQGPDTADAPDDAGSPDPRLVAGQAFFDQRFRAQIRDAVWSEPTEAALAMAVQEFQGARLRSAACGATMCRVEVAHVDAEARERFKETFAAEPVSGTDSAVILRDTSPSSHAVGGTVVFLMRPGNELPSPDGPTTEAADPRGGAN